MSRAPDRARRERDARWGPAAIGLRCAKCKAAPNQPCVVLSRVTGEPTGTVAPLLHAVRLLAAQKLAAWQGTRTGG